MGYVHFPFGSYTAADLPSACPNLTRELKNPNTMSFNKGDTVWIYFQKYQYATYGVILDVQPQYNYVNIYILDPECGKAIGSDSRTVWASLSELFSSEEELLREVFSLNPPAEHRRADADKEVNDETAV